MIRSPQREQKVAFASASNPHWGHLIADRFPGAPLELSAEENSRDYVEASAHGQFRAASSANRSSTFFRRPSYKRPSGRWPPEAPSW